MLLLLLCVSFLNDTNMDSTHLHSLTMIVAYRRNVFEGGSHVRDLVAKLLLGYGNRFKCKLHDDTFQT